MSEEDILKGRFFVFLEEQTDLKYHTLLIDAVTKEKAKEIALKQHKAGQGKIMIINSKMTVRVKPMRRNIYDE